MRCAWDGLSLVIFIVKERKTVLQFPIISPLDDLRTRFFRQRLNPCPGTTHFSVVSWYVISVPDLVQVSRLDIFIHNQHGKA